MNRTQKMALLSAVSLMLLMGCAVDIMLASLPDLARNFAVSAAECKALVFMYLLAYGATQAFSGVISDSVGRRPLVIASTLLFTFASFIAPFADSITQLHIIRIVQGFCAGWFGVVGRTLIGDVFEGREYDKNLSTIAMTWAIGPIVAPTIGGYLQEYFGWEANFIVLGCISGGAFLFTLFFLPETLRYKHALDVRSVLKRYKVVLSDKIFWSYSLSAGWLYGLTTAFGVVSTFVVQNILHKSASTYGTMSLMLGVAWFVGQAIYKRFFITRSDMARRRMLTLSQGGILVLLCLVAGLSFELPQSLWMVYAIPATGYMVTACALTYAFTKALEQNKEYSGSVNSLYGCVVSIMSGLAPALASHISPSILTLLALFAALTVLSMIFRAHAVRSEQKKYAAFAG
ncbi:MFS transporter [Desulfobaculum bizertense]|uniref:Multidrug resistance protein n=1 Tax=Desulfobaculum bizertense DSM 18034 TaxID=1121442 RepID=A0A1T4VW48_9BACT|nr:MFS transporter [Desulfobaculum bizertense]SKA69240.1 Multidrug resistance protein [Desulfobaculum bizertense DSM 18034]